MPITIHSDSQLDLYSFPDDDLEMHDTVVPTAFDLAASRRQLSPPDEPESPLFDSARRFKRSRVCPPTQKKETKSTRWACHICAHVQRNKRAPDLRRHIHAHERQGQEPEWVCCGIPAELAKDYGLPPNLPIAIWRGRKMVGGCRQEFSRRDAYKRHLNHRDGKCFGDVARYVREFR